MTEHAPARVGTSGWNKPQWRGYFYPPGLAQRRELEYAAERLATLELNTTFHGLPQPSSFERWRDDTPPHLVFAVKGNRAVTHEARLAGAASTVADFFACGVLGLDEKLGPILWQVPPSLPFDAASVEAFLATLPQTVGHARALVADRGRAEPPVTALGDERRIRHCFEVRHSSFLDPAFAAMLQRHSVAAVVVNAPGRPVVRELSADFAYVRLHSDAQHHPEGYDDATLDAWAARLDGWRSGAGSPDGRPRAVFAYFDNPDHTRTSSPFDAIRLQRRLDALAGVRTERPDTSIQTPLW